MVSLLGIAMATRSYTIRGDPEQMLRSLRAALPSGASLVGNSVQGGIDALFFGRIVDFNRTGTSLSVTVRRGVAGYSEAEIWNLIERGLRQYL